MVWWCQDLFCSIFSMDSRSFADAGVIHHIIFPTQKVEKNHLYKVNSGACKILHIPKIMRKLGVPEPQEPQDSCSQVFMLFMMLGLGAQTVFALKSCLSGTTTDTFVQRQHCVLSVTQRREGGMLSHRISGRHCHCSECKWAEELNRWLQ